MILVHIPVQSAERVVGCLRDLHKPRVNRVYRLPTHEFGIDVYGSLWQYTRNVLLFAWNALMHVCKDIGSSLNRLHLVFCLQLTQQHITTFIYRQSTLHLLRLLRLLRLLIYWSLSNGETADDCICGSSHRVFFHVSALL